jgi:hypothetical protein
MTIAYHKALIKGYKDALRAWVDAQSGLTSAAQWRDESGGWQSKTRALLHLSSARGLGTDIKIWNQDGGEPAGSDYIPTFSGLREFTFSIFVESRDQKDGGIATTYLEKLRASTRKSSVRTALTAAGLSVSTTEEVQDLSHWVQDRWESKAQLDVHLNAVVNEVDTDEADSFVQTFGVTAELEDPAGSDRGWTEEEFP